MKHVLVILCLLLTIPTRCFATDLNEIFKIKDQKRLRVSSYDAAGKNRDFRLIAPGETLTVAEITGPACITHIWMTIWHEEENYLKKTILRMYWDGEETPSVECPLGDFFGLGHAKAYHYESSMFSIGTAKGFNSFWPMPFNKSAKITLTNEGTVKVRAFFYYVDYHPVTNFEVQNTGYFHAQYRQGVPCADGEDYLLMETEGKGHYMGCNLSIRLNTAGWWGEGDDKIYIDGDTEPTLIGTGSEDYFCGAWCYGKDFAYDYFGCPLRGKDGPGGEWNVYRYHIDNPVRFTKSIKVAIEHGRSGYDNTRDGGNNNYFSVSYWYQLEPHKKFPVLPSLNERFYGNRPQVEFPKDLIEVEDIMPPVEGENGTVHKQKMLGYIGAWSKDTQSLFKAKDVGGFITLAFNLDKKADYEMNVYLTKGKEYGIVNIYVNGKKIAENIDCYNDKVVDTGAISLGKVSLESGENRIKFEVAGKNKNAKSYFIGMDAMQVKQLR